jgi:hypothetical protein
MTKKCSLCSREKRASEFYRCKIQVGGLQRYCKDCSRRAARARHESRVSNYSTACRLAYKALKSRCTGKHYSRCAHIYRGLPYCSRREFDMWAEQPAIKAEWERLAAVWRVTGARGDAPSIDRLSAHVDVGYIPHNMRWCSHRDNATKAMIQMHHGRAACPPDFTKELVCA